MKFLVINGPNLNMLGIREPELYGHKDYAALCAFIRQCCADEDVSCELYQSNHEGAIVDAIQSAYRNADGIVLNAAAYTHTSVAIHDALKAVSLPVAEVHLTDIDAREEFRRVSYIAPLAVVRETGQGFESYRRAIRGLKTYITDHPKGNA